jgi:hypothetical protein
MFWRMSFGFFVHESNMGTLSHQNPFVFAIFYHFTRKYSMLFINYFHLLSLILLGFGVFQFKHYLVGVSVNNIVKMVFRIFQPSSKRWRFNPGMEGSCHTPGTTV